MRRGANLLNGWKMETAESQAAIAKVRDWVSEHLLDD